MAVFDFNCPEQRASFCKSDRFLEKNDQNQQNPELVSQKACTMVYSRQAGNGLIFIVFLLLLLVFIEILLF